MQQEINQAKKNYPIEMHTAEHILNQTMIRLFGCERSKNAHIERKKSKCDYHLLHEPSTEQIAEIEHKVNEIIALNLSVTDKIVMKTDIPACVDTSKLPDDASELIRLVYIGDYDICACIGEHVTNTRDIGVFKIISTDYTTPIFRIRFKLIHP